MDNICVDIQSHAEGRGICSILQIGKTKLFLRAGQMAELDARRAEVLSIAAKTIQRRVRTHYARKRFIALRQATIVMQSICRGESHEKFIRTNQAYNYMQCYLVLRENLTKGCSYDFPLLSFLTQLFWGLSLTG